jgi:hypothetical protein
LPMKMVRVIKMFLKDTYCRVRVGTHLSDVFSVTNGLKHRHAVTSISVSSLIMDRRFGFKP